MNLDLPTLLIMESFVPVCAGAVLHIAWSHNRKIFSLALWGLADLAVAGGILSLMLGATLRQPLWSLLGGVLFAPCRLNRSTQRLEQLAINNDDCLSNCSPKCFQRVPPQPAIP